MSETTWHENSSSSLDEMSGKVMVAAIVILVMVILFVLLVHLYARWFWSRHGGAEIHLLGRSRSRMVFAPARDPSHKGLEASVFQALPLVVFKQDDFKDGLECAVCLCELEDGEKARLLPKCNHGFHVECIDMWFQSHSTCPLCRITVGADCSELSSPGTQTEEANSDSDRVHTIELPNFPTNVLFWGNGSSVIAGNNGAEEVPATSSPPQSPCSSKYATPNISRDGSLIIDIPTRLVDGFSSRSPSASKSAEEMKSPMTPMSARFRSLTRLLSRGKRVNPSSPSSVDVEQGEGGIGQSSKTSSDP